VDPAVALAQGYLRLNDCFTVTEYPIFELGSGGGVRTATDLDLFAFGGSVDGDQATGYQRMSLSHVIGFVAAFVGDNWSVLRHGQTKDATLALLWLLQKRGVRPRQISEPPRPRATGTLSRPAERGRGREGG